MVWPLLCQFPLTSIREVKLLQALHHRHLVRLLAMAVGRRPDSIFLVFEYLPHDLASLCDRHARLAASTPLFTESQAKRLTLQLLSGVAYLHSHFTMHRDLKLSNLLLSAQGQVKVADFGLARVFSNPLELFSYTPKVVTLWYRAPELLLASAFPAAAAAAAASYHSAVDIWAVGCIVAELLLGRPLFPGANEAEQLELICRLLGSPNEKIWPAFALLQPPPALPHYPYNQLAAAFGAVGREGVALLGRLLTFDPSKRITADKAQRHAWFSEQPTPADEDCMPAWPHGAQPRGEADGAATAAAAHVAPVGGRKRRKEAVDSGSNGRRRTATAAAAAEAAVEQQMPAHADYQQRQHQADDGSDLQDTV